MVKPRGNGRTKQGPAARAALPRGYSATHGLPAALERALGDYQQRQPCPPVVCDGAAAAAAAQASPSVTKSLNVAPGYAPHFQSGIRELIQSWQDQCQVVAGYGAMHVADLTQPSAVAAGSLLLAACCGARCCGYLALAAPGVGGVGAGVCDVFLCNYASTIAMSAMTLGESSKRDNATLAGCFGEGAKVEINRIVASGASVTYHTSNQEWSFRYEEELGGQVLQVHSTRISDTPSHDTLAVVRGAQRAWFQRPNYLFLSPKPVQRFGGTPGSAGSACRLELLPEAEHAGRVYAHGIFVASLAPQPRGGLSSGSTVGAMPLYGLNVLGSAQGLALVGIGRDRNTVWPNSMMAHVAELFAEYQPEPAAQLELARLMYTALHEYPLSAWQFVRWCTTAAAQAMGDAMYRAFWGKHTDATVPICASDPAGTDAEYLGFATAKVSAPLYEVLKKSRHHLTPHQLWERRRQQLLALPAHQWQEGDKADRYRRALVDALLASFPKYLTPDNLQVKALPFGNRNIIVALPPRPSPGSDGSGAAGRGGGTRAATRAAGGSGSEAAAQAVCYIVDLTALSHAAVHARLQASDATFECSRPCACLPIALEDAAIVAIAVVRLGRVTEAQLRRELRQAQHAHHGLGWTGDSIGGPGHQAHAALDGGEPMKPEHGEHGRSKNGTAGGITAGGAAGGSRPREQGYERLPVLTEADLAAAVRSSLDSAAGPCSTQLQRCGGGAGGTVRVTVEVAADCRDGPGALMPSGITLGGGRRLFLPERVAPSSISQAQVRRCRRLWRLLDGMHSQVFLESQVGAPTRFVLYFDPEDGFVAFNLLPPGSAAAEVWYNAAFDPAEGDAQLRAAQWFLTACHELAHNFVRCHDTTFADTMGQIVMRFTPAFHAWCPAAGA